MNRVSLSLVLAMLWGCWAQAQVVDTSARQDLVILKNAPQLFKVELVPGRGEVRFLLTELEVGRFDLSHVTLKATLREQLQEKQIKDLNIKKDVNGYYIISGPLNFDDQKEIHVEATSGSKSDKFVLKKGQLP